MTPVVPSSYVIVPVTWLRRLRRSATSAIAVGSMSTQARSCVLASEIASPSVENVFVEPPAASRHTMREHRLRSSSYRPRFSTCPPSVTYRNVDRMRCRPITSKSSRCWRGLAGTRDRLPSVIPGMLAGLGSHTPSRTLVSARRNRSSGRVILPIDGATAAPEMATAADTVMSRARRLPTRAS
jgi:hypothetical protein